MVLLFGGKVDEKIKAGSIGVISYDRPELFIVQSPELFYGFTKGFEQASADLANGTCGSWR